MFVVMKFMFSLDFLKYYSAYARCYALTDFVMNRCYELLSSNSSKKAGFS